MGEVQDRACPLVKHIGIEAFGPKQSDIALEPVLHLFQPGELAGKHLFSPLEIGARLQAVIAGLKVIAEIAGSPAGKERKDESLETHVPSPLRVIPAKAGIQ